MLSKKAQGTFSGGAIGGTVIIIVLLTFILIYIAVVPSEYKEEFNLTPTPPADYVVLEEHPGRLFIEDEDSSKTEFNTVSIEDVVLDNTPEQESTLLLPQGIVKKSLFSADILTFSFDVDDLDAINKIYLSANIIDKRGSGLVIVKLNGVTIYESEEPINKNLKITLPRHYLLESNTIKITTSSPGWMFWTVNSYVLSDIYVIEDLYSEDDAKVRRIVFINSETLADAKSIKFSAYPKRISDEDKEVNININGNTIYSGVPISNSGIDIEISKEHFKSGTNNIEFEVEKNGKYELIYMDLLFKTVEVKDEGMVKYTFSISDKQWEKVEDSRYECELFASKTSGDKSINIELNDNVLRYSFDNNYEISRDVCEFLEREDNEITITPDEEVYLNVIKITIQNK
ncbi:MAG: hypothetical protein JSW73_02885 [Candidatus Woesearchaeota archaeon]|nr:MAG: hypothetical protein JSW73_02885 [Candidatus Woesearchaeota archaeon]